MMISRALALACGLSIAAASCTSAHAACSIKVFADLALEPVSERALFKGAINGVPALLLADTGAQFSLISEREAMRFGRGASGSQDLTVYGVGGGAGARVARLDLTLGRFLLKNHAMALMDSRPLDHGADAIIGMDFLASNDLELDLGGHAMRVLKPQGCKAPELVYWNKPYAQANLVEQSSEARSILVDVLLNGHRLRAEVDSGAPVSIITPAAATLAGVRYEAAPVSGSARGIATASRVVDQRLARFDTFTIGDETIRNAQIRVADLWVNTKVEEVGTRLGSLDDALSKPRMLIGADFLRAHRVMVANSMGLLLFSYTGGPVFDVTSAPVSAKAPATDDAPPAPKP